MPSERLGILKMSLVHCSLYYSAVVAAGHKARLLELKAFGSSHHNLNSQARRVLGLCAEGKSTKEIVEAVQ